MDKPCYIEQQKNGLSEVQLSEDQQIQISPAHEPAGTKSFSSDMDNKRLISRNGTEVKTISEENNEKGVRLVIHDISCKLKKKFTLQNVTGVVQPGEFYAIMGPSGAGKTMLLDIVCFRKSMGKIKGAVLYNGKLPTRQFMQKNVAYVEQQITIQNSFTVQEAILYSALLKRSKSKYGRDEINATVEAAIEQLGLQKIRKSRIGNSKLVRGISGGEARRVSIGISLVQLTKPGLLCLDEPTTGLDSAIGNDIMKIVRDCAEDGWTVVSTIHNPSTMMMDYIDGLVLIVASRVIWFGPYNLDTIKKDYAAHGFDVEKAIHIVEYLLQVVGGGSKGAQEEILDKACEVYRESPACKSNYERAVEYAKEANVDAICDCWRSPKKYIKDAGHIMHDRSSFFANSIMGEIGVLVSFRSFSLLRDPNFVLTRLGIFAVQAFIFATFWADRDMNIGGLIDTIAVLFAVPVAMSIPFGLFIPELISHRASFVREQHEGCYRIFSYASTVLLTEFVIVAVGAMVFTLIIYFALGTFPMTVSSFFFYYFNVWVMALNSVIFASVATNMSRTMELALLIAPLYWLWNALVMGFIAKYSAIPPWYRWTYWLAYLQYAFSGSVLNQFQGQNWNMCSELSSGLSMTSIVSELKSEDVTDVATDLLDSVQNTIQNATSMTLPFEIAEAYCYDKAAGNETVLPDMILSIFPSPSMLQTILNLLPTFLGGPPGAPRPKCDELCLPVPGSKLIEMYGLDPTDNKWNRLGFGVLFIFIHFGLMCLSLMYARYFEKR